VFIEGPEVAWAGCGIAGCESGDAGSIAGMVEEIQHNDGGLRRLCCLMICTLGLSRIPRAWWSPADRSVEPDHVIRSRKQHPFTTCKLSVDVPHLRVHVQERPWSSVAVDVLTDVDEGGSSVALWPAVCLLANI